MKSLVDNFHIRNQLGLSLIECVMVMGVATAVAVVSAAAIPMVKQYSENASKDSVLDDMHSSALAAKSAAIYRAKNITVCASNNGFQCSGELTDWNRGWIVFEDDGTHAVTVPAQIISKKLRSSSDNTLISTAESSFFTFGVFGSLVSTPSRLAIRVETKNKLDSKCLLIVPPGWITVIRAAKEPENCPAVT